MKEGLIKKVSIDNFILEHTRYRDFVGVLRDMFDVIEEKKEGSPKFLHTPICPPIKVNNYDKNTNIFEMVNDYSEEEMLSVLKEHIQKIKQ
jgi:hypothetical protein